MAGLYIGSTTGHAGKSLLSFSLGLLLQKAGYSVGYMKPVGGTPCTVDDALGDKDALIVQEVLGQQAPADIVTPVVLPASLHALSLQAPCCKESRIQHIRTAYNQIAADKNAVIVSGIGSILTTGRVCCADGISIVQGLGLQTVLVEHIERGYSCDALLKTRDHLGDALCGVIFNAVTPKNQRDVTGVITPYLASHGIPVLGVIPYEPALIAMRVADIAYGLNGHVLAGNARTASLVEGFFIGAMQVENFMTYLRTLNNNIAVVVGGDRTDLQLAAIHQGCPCLILSGNLTPSELVCSRADKAGIPLITVADNTFEVSRSLSALFMGKKLHELSQIRLGANLVASALDTPALLPALFGLAG